ncbi:MAG: hypothetical protein P4N41_14435 [Negativicutes bacterium]|nr:hypothetical protein [Negativicutes bacterium]
MNKKLTKILIIIAIILAVSNPSEEQYTAKAESKLMSHNQAVAAFWVKPALTSATVRTNLVFCSLYRTELRDQTYISIGVLGNIIFLSP